MKIPSASRAFPLHPLRWGPIILIIALNLGFGSGCAGINESRRTDAHSAITPRGEFRQMTFGLCEDYPEESRSLAAARRDLEVLATNHLQALRIAFGWDAMEPERRQFDWSFWDEFVRMAVDDFNIRLIPYVCYTPRWASSNRGEDFWQQPPRDNADFAAFLKQLVHRYRDRIHSWELWNEPDNPAYWAGTPEQFADLLAAGAQAVHEADPNATIVFGGLAWNLNFLETVLASPQAMRHVDVVNLHNYFETWSSDPLEELSAYVGRAHDILQQHGRPLPIWMAEVGYSSHRQGARVSGQYQAYYRHEHSAEAQAAAVTRILAMLLASERVPLAAWYRINDLPSTQEVIGDVNNRHLGVLDENGRAKPALQALAFFARLFRDGCRCIDDQVRVTRPIAAPVEMHAFERPDGSLVVIAWLKSYVPGSRTGELSGNLPDARTVEMDLHLPIASKASVHRLDELGNRRERLRLVALENGSVLRALSLRNGEVAVLVMTPG